MNEPVTRRRFLNAISIGGGDDPFSGGGDQNIAGNFQDVLNTDGLRARIADDAAPLLLITQDGGGVKPGFIVDTTACIADGDDL